MAIVHVRVLPVVIRANEPFQLLLRPGGVHGSTLALRYRAVDHRAIHEWGIHSEQLR
jgi:hypothetical protein